MEKYELSLERAKSCLKTADHLIYITMPVVQENRLILKALEQIYEGTMNIINSILQYEYLNKNIKIYTDAKENFKTFENLAIKYKISENSMEKIIDIIKTGKQHKQSPFEFSKNEKMVIVSDNMQTKTITQEKIKEFLLESKDLLRKTINMQN